MFTGILGSLFDTVEWEPIGFSVNRIVNFHYYRFVHTYMCTLQMFILMQNSKNRDVEIMMYVNVAKVVCLFVDIMQVPKNASPEIHVKMAEYA